MSSQRVEEIRYETVIVVTMEGGGSEDEMILQEEIACVWWRQRGRSIVTAMISLNMCKFGVLKGRFYSIRLLTSRDAETV